MAEENVDGVLTRLDEIEKLQTELRHLVPRVANSSSRYAGRQDSPPRDSPPRDSPRDPPVSVRFPSLFTFPVISNFTSTPRNERDVKKSAAQLNLNGRSSSGNQRPTVNLRKTGGSSQNGTSVAREANVFKGLLRSSCNEVGKSHPRNSSASTSAADSRVPIRSGIANRMPRVPQEAIKKRLKIETSRAAARDKAQRATGERSNMRLSGNENNVDSILHSVCSSVQTSDIQIYVTEATESRGAQSRLIRRNRPCNGSGLVERIMKKFNYCFVDDNRVTVPYHHPGSRTPRRVQILHSPAIEEMETPRLHGGVSETPKFLSLKNMTHKKKIN